MSPKLEPDIVRLVAPEVNRLTRITDDRTGASKVTTAVRVADCWRIGDNSAPLIVAASDLRIAAAAEGLQESEVMDNHAAIVEVVPDTLLADDARYERHAAAPITVT